MAHYSRRSEEGNKKAHIGGFHIWRPQNVWPPYHVHKSADFVPFVCFLGTPHPPTADVIYGSPLTWIPERSADVFPAYFDSLTEFSERYFNFPLVSQTIFHSALSGYLVYRCRTQIHPPRHGWVNTWLSNFLNWKEEPSPPSRPSLSPSNVPARPDDAAAASARVRD